MRALKGDVADMALHTLLDVILIKARMKLYTIKEVSRKLNRPREKVFFAGQHVET